jgi:hypothetical protein
MHKEELAFYDYNFKLKNLPDYPDGAFTIDEAS